MSGPLSAPDPRAELYPVDEDQARLAAAWLTVLLTVHPASRATIGVLGLEVLGTRRMFRCESGPCGVGYVHPAVSFSGVVEHLRQHPEAAPAFRVMTR